MVANVFVPFQICTTNLPYLFQYSASIEENCLSSELIRLQAIDLDEEGTDNWLAQYSILSGNDGNWFEIQTDPKTNEGILKLVKVSMGSVRAPSKEVQVILRLGGCLQKVLQSPNALHMHDFPGL